MHTVDGKVIVITGAGKGIGKGLALHLGKGGASIVVAEWKPDLMEETCAELDTLGIPNLGIVCDVNERTRSKRWSRRRSKGSAASTASSTTRRRSGRSRRSRT